MKELETPLTQSRHEQAIHAESKQKQEYRFIGKCKVRSGLKLWAYNPDENTMTEVSIDRNTVVDFTTGLPQSNDKAQYNPKLNYFQAINEKNAWKKLEKLRAGDHSVEENFDYDETKFEKINLF